MDNQTLEQTSSTDAGFIIAADVYGRTSYYAPEHFAHMAAAFRWTGNRAHATRYPTQEAAQEAIAGSGAKYGKPPEVIPA